MRIAADDLDTRLSATLNDENEGEDDGDDETHLSSAKDPLSQLAHLDGETQCDDKCADHLQEVGPSSGLVVEDDLVRRLGED